MPWRPRNERGIPVPDEFLPRLPFCLWRGIHDFLNAKALTYVEVKVSQYVVFCIFVWQFFYLIMVLPSCTPYTHNIVLQL